MVAALEAGQNLGEWILEVELGRGANGSVWQARHKALPRSAALKVPHDEGVTARLAREGRLLERVESEHVVGLLGLDPDHDPPYLVMELVEGTSLRTLLEEGPLEPSEARRILAEICRGLAAAHAQGVVHRDLKPENVLLDAEGRVRVADFGLGALAAEAAHELLASGSLQTREGSVVGTLRYMAPEARDPSGELDARTDLYALGVILFEALTGEAPCGGEVPSDVRPELDPRWDPLYRSLCARLPQRLESASKVLERLSGIGDLPCAPDAVEAGSIRCVRAPAGPLVRGFALLVDLLPFVVLAALTLRWGRGLPALGAFVIYDVLATAMVGTTLGKHLCGVEVTDAEGRAPTLAQAFQRAAMRLVSMGALGLGYLPTLAGRRAFHDAFANTQVLTKD
jgi:uncharacterized RDD family membrane protein YckC/predicted Ser/Thr protein kinase